MGLLIDGMKLRKEISELEGMSTESFQTNAKRKKNEKMKHSGRVRPFERAQRMCNWNTRREKEQIQQKKCLNL